MSLWLSGALRIILMGCTMLAWSMCDIQALGRTMKAGFFIVGIGVWIMAAVPWSRSRDK